VGQLVREPQRDEPRARVVVLAKQRAEAPLLLVGERPAEAVGADDGGQQEESREEGPEDGGEQARVLSARI
jgi:hypothetical protein